MRISRSLYVLAMSGLLALAPAALAQDAQPEAPAGAKLGPRAGGAQQQGQPANIPPTETIATHGAWSVQCTEIPAGADENAPQGGKSCGMIQNTKAEKNEKIQLSLIVNKVKRGDKSAVFMRIIAPIGVYLPTGIPVEIDGAALPNRMQFTRCLPRICEGFGEASPESLAKFKKGGAATFYIYDRPGSGYPMKISLEGFGAALEELDKF